MTGEKYRYFVTVFVTSRSGCLKPHTGARNTNVTAKLKRIKERRKTYIQLCVVLGSAAVLRGGVMMLR